VPCRAEVLVGDVGIPGLCVEDRDARIARRQRQRIPGVTDPQREGRCCGGSRKRGWVGQSVSHRHGSVSRLGPEFELCSCRPPAVWRGRLNYHRGNLWATGAIKHTARVIAHTGQGWSSGPRPMPQPSDDAAINFVSL
jgi:hypothetical protein